MALFFSSRQEDKSECRIFRFSTTFFASLFAFLYLKIVSSHLFKSHSFFIFFFLVVTSRTSQNQLFSVFSQPSQKSQSVPLLPFSSLLNSTPPKTFLHVVFIPFSVFSRTSPCVSSRSTSTSVFSSVSAVDVSPWFELLFYTPPVYFVL